MKNRTILFYILFIFIYISSVSANEARAEEIYIQTFCFSKSSCDRSTAIGALGDGVNLCGGECQGKTLRKMNIDGWRLIQVVDGLDSSFGMLFEIKGEQYLKLRNEK